ncbi:2OG-Fe(II) oxygenase superfamily protein [Geopyxis carbonaria]|nr:2OG-Fe(II) oxygenase superfamily protein [Geopyxis carbonaria]
MPPKRPLQITSFFTPTAQKKLRPTLLSTATEPPDTHPSYPFAIAKLPASLIATTADEIPPTHPHQGQPNLSLSLYRPLLHPALAATIYTHLLTSLPFYRVTYPITRGGTQVLVHTPRYTTVFGLDATSAASANSTTPHRPLPSCLRRLKDHVETRTGARFNFVLVNYYAGSADSIAWHSDGETFLEERPGIASLSLGGVREFWMRPAGTKLEFLLRSGDCLLMDGATQRAWEHCVPKRGDAATAGRINVTFRYVVKKEGTANYYRYNVGAGPVWRWDEEAGEMRLWEKEGDAKKNEVKKEEGAGEKEIIETATKKGGDVVKKEEVEAE